MQQSFGLRVLVPGVHGDYLQRAGESPLQKARSLAADQGEWRGDGSVLGVDSYRARGDIGVSPVASGVRFEITYVLLQLRRPDLVESSKPEPIKAHQPIHCAYPQKTIGGLSNCANKVLRKTLIRRPGRQDILVQ